MMQLPQNNPSWMSANMALRELYDSQESITLRSVNEGAMQILASGPGGSSSKDCKYLLFACLRRQTEQS